MTRLSVLCRRVADLVDVVAFASLALAVALFLAPVGVHAAPRTADPAFLKEAGYLPAGPVRIYPALQVEGGYTDNLFATSENEVSARFLQVSPEFATAMMVDRTALLLAWQMNAHRVENSESDDVTDHELMARGRTEWGLRHRLDMELATRRSHEARGTGVGRYNDPEMDLAVMARNAFTDDTARGQYTFGAPGAAGNLRFGLATLDRTYTNNREQTRYFDRQEQGVAATFLVRALPRTRLAIEGRLREVTYDNAIPGQLTLDSREQALLFGAEWEVASKTSGSLRIGQYDKNFDVAGFVDSQRLGWEATAEWSPRSYSNFELGLQRTPQETDGRGSFIETEQASLRWSHRWSERVHTGMEIRNEDRAYQGVERQESIDGAEISFGYAMSRWLTWTLSADWDDQQSDVNWLSFERNAVSLGAEVTL